MIARSAHAVLLTVGALSCLAAPLAAQAGGAPSSGISGFPDTLDGERYRATGAGRVVIRFAARDALVAERVLAFFEGQAPLPGLPDTLPRRVTAVLAHSAAAFDELTGGVVPEWRAGVAIPGAGLLVVPTGEGPRILDPEGRRTLRHEWAHLGLHEYFRGLRIPRWFDEGYAQWASGGFDASEAWRLRVLIALGRAPPLDSLALTWPDSREEARSAYLLAASAVALLLEPAGERGLTLFFERWRAAGSFDDALRRTFGATPGQFEEDWKRHVRSRYGWLLVLSRSAALWAIMALVLLVMARVRRSRNRERFARLRASELPEAPAFWIEPDIERDIGPERGPPGVGSV